MEYEITIYGMVYIIVPTQFHVGYPGDREQPKEPSYWEYDLLNEDGTPADIHITEEIEAKIQEMLCD